MTAGSSKEISAAKKAKTVRLSQIELFAQAFTDEAHLREAIADLLRKMGRRDVQITHGSREKGKDIVFLGPGGLDELSLYACVVKKDAITGRADSNSGARTVFHQAEQALDTPLIDSSGAKRFVERVFIMSPYQLSAASRESIEGALRSRFGQATFKCGSELLDMFASHWPEFILFDSEILTTYLTSLRTLDDQVALKSLISSKEYGKNLLAEAVKPLSKVYVNPTVRQQFLAFSLRTFPREVQIPEEFNSLTPKRVANEFAVLRQWAEMERFWPGERIPDQTMVSRVDEFLKEVATCWASASTANAEKERVRKSQDAALPQPVPTPLRSRVRLILAESKQLTERSATIRKEIQAIYHRADADVRRWSRTLNLDSTSQDVDRELYERCFAAHRAYITLIDASMSSFMAPITIELDSNLQSFLITGPAGFGKTSFCRWHTLKDAQAYEAGVADVIPIYRAIHLLHCDDSKSFEDALFASPELKRLLNSKKRKSRKVRVYLDGLDEVASEEKRRRLVELAQDLIDNMNGQVQVVLTSRDYISGSWINWLTRVRIDEFSPARVDELVAKWLDGDVHRIEELNAQLSRSPSLKQLMRVPLLGTLILAVYRHIKEVPSTKNKLYELFVDLHCGGWDFVKGVNRDCRFGLVEKVLVLMKLASTMQYENHRSADESYFKVAVITTVPTLKDKWNGLLEEVLHEGLLLRVSGSLLFAHLSFQEYLTARYLASGTGGGEAALRTFLRGEDWWRGVLGFYVGFSSRVQDTLSWLQRIEHSVGESSTQRKQDLRERVKYLKDCVHEAFPTVTGLH
jgi:hypothetical protein